MKVRDLIEILETMNDDSTVKIAYQPSYPMTEAATGIDEVDGRVYLAGDGESGYLPGEAAAELF